MGGGGGGGGIQAFKGERNSRINTAIGGVEGEENGEVGRRGGGEDRETLNSFTCQ